MHFRAGSFGAAARLLLLAMLLAASPTVLGFSTPERKGWVTDQAGILDADTARAIADRLAALQRNTGYEVVVVTLGSLEGASIETWGNMLGESWRIGRSGGNETGALLIVAPKDRKVRIAVGYGLGHRLSDSIAAAIIADHILPYFRQGDFAQGVKSGVTSIALQLDRPAAAQAQGSDVERAYTVSVQRPDFWTWLRHKLTPSRQTMVIALWVAVGLIVLVCLVLYEGAYGSRRRGRRYDDDDWSSDDDSGSGWFSSDGGSSSGSGSSGGGSFGGGATGSW